MRCASFYAFLGFRDVKNCDITKTELPAPILRVNKTPQPCLNYKSTGPFLGYLKSTRSPLLVDIRVWALPPNVFLVAARVVSDGGGWDWSCSWTPSSRGPGAGRVRGLRRRGVLRGGIRGRRRSIASSSVPSVVAEPRAAPRMHQEFITTAMSGARAWSRPSVLRPLGASACVSECCVVRSTLRVPVGLVARPGHVPPSGGTAAEEKASVPVRYLKKNNGPNGAHLPKKKNQRQLRICTTAPHIMFPNNSMVNVLWSKHLRFVLKITDIERQPRNMNEAAESTAHAPNQSNMATTVTYYYNSTSLTTRRTNLGFLVRGARLPPPLRPRLLHLAYTS